MIPKVAVPRFADLGDITKWLGLENFPGEFPYTAGIFPFKREEWHSTFFLASGKDWFENNAINDKSMQKWQREMKLHDADTGQPNDKLNIGGYRSAKIWKPKRINFGYGTLWKYAQTVGPAYLGASTHPGGKEEIKCYADI